MIYLLLLFVLSGCTPKQILVVKPLDNSKATLYFYENGQKIYEFDANIGRNGIALDGTKREGDGKTPSGIFQISTLFAYDDHQVDMPFVKSDKNTICVDDIKSKHYNKIVDSNTTAKDWDSFEFMRRDDEQYLYGAIVDYNHERVAGLGSCIFIHIKKSETSPTAGCVALNKKDMQTLFLRLNKNKNPTIAITQSDNEFAKILRRFELH